MWIAFDWLPKMDLLRPRDLFLSQPLVVVVDYLLVLQLSFFNWSNFSIFFFKREKNNKPCVTFDQVRSV